MARSPPARASKEPACRQHRRWCRSPRAACSLASTNRNCLVREGGPRRGASAMDQPRPAPTPRRTRASGPRFQAGSSGPHRSPGPRATKRIDQWPIRLNTRGARPGAGASGAQAHQGRMPARLRTGRFNPTAGKAPINRTGGALRLRPEGFEHARRSPTCRLALTIAVLGDAGTAGGGHKGTAVEMLKLPRPITPVHQVSTGAAEGRGAGQGATAWRSTGPLPANSTPLTPLPRQGGPAGHRLSSGFNLGRRSSRASSPVASPPPSDSTSRSVSARAGRGLVDWGLVMMGDHSGSGFGIRRSGQRDSVEWGSLSG